MLTLLSDKEIHQIHSYMTEMATTVENLTRVLGGAQTVHLDMGQTPSVSPQQKATRKTASIASEAPGKSQSKTRMAHRPGRGNAVLTAKKVAEIKHWLSKGKSTSTLARQFKVHWSTINCIKHGKTWKNIQPAESTPVKPLEIVEIRK
jgi:hypothetical protein